MPTVPPNAITAATAGLRVYYGKRFSRFHLPPRYAIRELPPSEIIGRERIFDITGPHGTTRVYVYPDGATRQRLKEVSRA
jgi:hypothetical protein